MGFPMNFDAVMRRFRTTQLVNVYDSEGGYTHGIWSMGEFVKREEPLSAIILATSDQRMELAKEGHSSSGDLVVITKTPLYFTELIDDVQTTKQSFIEYQGKMFRVMSYSYTSSRTDISLSNSNFLSYVCERYIP